MAGLRGVLRHRIRPLGTCGFFALLLGALLPTARAEESDWYKQASKRVREAIDDGVAARIAGITHPTGKNPRLIEVSTQPDEDGLVAVISVRWHGGVLGTRYNTVVQWRVSPRGHLNSGIVRDDSLAPVPATARTELDNYLRDQLWPKVKGAGEADSDGDLGAACRSIEAEATRFLAKPIAQAAKAECQKLLRACADAEKRALAQAQKCEREADEFEARAKRLEDLTQRAASPEEKSMRQEAAVEFSRKSKAARDDAQMWRKRSAALVALHKALEQRMEALE